MSPLKVNEIFQSIQGEGYRAGHNSIFIRLSGCNLSCSFCDTEHNKYREMSLEEIYDIIKLYNCNWIVWTGGEPLLQLIPEHLLFFSTKGYRQAIETNGEMVPNALATLSLLEHISISPKTNAVRHWVTYNILRITNHSAATWEIRLPIELGEYTIPIKGNRPLPSALHLYVSPVMRLNPAATLHNIQWAVDIVKSQHEWQLSVQIHKLLSIK